MCQTYLYYTTVVRRGFNGLHACLWDRLKQPSLIHTSPGVIIVGKNLAQLLLYYV